MPGPLYAFKAFESLQSWSNWHKIQLCDKFSSVIFICLTPFSQLYFGPTGCMILIKEYVSLKTIAMKMSKRHF